MTSKKIGIIILAAGNSSRLGEPKQLLQSGDKNLIQKTVQAAVASKLAPILVVTGSLHDQIKESLAGYSVHLVQNTDWEDGIGSSIKTGVLEIKKIDPQLDALILAVCDQPYLNVNVFSDLVKQYLYSDKRIITSQYNQTLGTPTLFSKDYFYELIHTDSDSGAKKLLAKFSHDIDTISFPLGYIDIDTQEDWEAFLKEGVQDSK